MKHAQSMNSNSNNQLSALDNCLEYIIETHQPRINPLMKSHIQYPLKFSKGEKRWDRVALLGQTGEFIPQYI